MALRRPESYEPIPLPADEVHVWNVPIPKQMAPGDERWTLLRRDEQEQAECFRVEDARHRFIAGRSALRRILGHYLGLLPQDVELDDDPYGKPRLAPSQHGIHLASEVRFNVAHSGELALVAVALGCEVGVDVERLRQVKHVEQLARRFLHPAEADSVMEADVPARANAFLRCWTRKEAVLKAIGAGIHFPLDRFHVLVNEQAAAWVELPAWKKFALTRCWLVPMEPSADYTAAVSCVGSERRVRA
ncbi:MAG: 4'-phosphopantetheinyl transferase superfamily protein, partial [Planctomycetes bacterium]|nr:4'-phosphopantetheinyl transferase superfamily protein [Planctomycetota bacterium]